MKKHQRSFVSLLTASSFIVLAVTGILAFVRPFSLGVVGLHGLMGFVFVGLIALHVANNLSHLSQYVRGKILWLTLAITAGLTGLFLWQPGPIQSILALSQNLGPASDRFELKDDGLVYHYTPAEQYKMALTIRAGQTFDARTPPHVAIWLENASFYHIKTLHEPDDQGSWPSRSAVLGFQSPRLGRGETKGGRIRQGSERAAGSRWRLRRDAEQFIRSRRLHSARRFRQSNALPSSHRNRPA